MKITTMIRVHTNRVLERKGTPYIILIILSLLSLAPFYWSLVTSLKSRMEVFSWPPTLFPNILSMEGYKFSLIYSSVLKYLFNSTIYSLCVSIFVLVFGLITIYGITFYPYPGSNKVLLIFFLTRILPPQAMWLPFVILFSAIGMSGRPLPVIIYEIVLVYPMAIWMFKSIFDSFPREIIESAVIDGCSRLKALYRIVVPVVAPAIAAIGIISFLWSWNEFMFPYLVLQSENLWPITVGVIGFLGEEGFMWNALSATQILAILPGLIFFIFAQKYIVKGLVAGSVKG